MKKRSDVSMISAKPEERAAGAWAGLRVFSAVMLLLWIGAGEMLPGQQTAHGIPLDAPEESVLDQAELLTPSDEAILQEAIRDLLLQTEIRAWVVTGEAATDQESLRAASRRVHTWMDSGMGLVLFYSGDAGVVPHLGASQDLMAKMNDRELQELRSQFQRIWQGQGGNVAGRLTLSSLHVLEFQPFYRLESGMNRARDLSIGLTSDQVDRESLDTLRGSYRKSWELNEDLRAEPPVAATSLPESKFTWRWQVIIINIVIFALFVSGGVWWYLYLRGLQQQREEAMRRGGEELSGGHLAPGGGNAARGGKAAGNAVNNSPSNDKGDIY